MTEKEFLRAVSNGEADILQRFLDLLAQTRTPFCVVGGLAVNAYVDPVVSLDLDIVVAAARTDALCDAARTSGFEIEKFPHSINLSAKKSDLRIQLQSDGRYQAFIARAKPMTVLGYPMPVARPEDVLAGKAWAFQDETRRKSKRQKDLADISRLIEAMPHLAEGLPAAVKARLE